MNKIIPFFLLVSSFSSANSQSLPCGGGRFAKTVFTGSNVTPGILFGHNTTINGVSEDLSMDIYEPAGDTATIRPLIVFAFGGAFLEGDRTQLGPLCDSMARKGYVTATIDYRLYDKPGGINAFIANPNDAIDAMARAMSDMKASIRYFKRDAATSNSYRIDTNSIFVGGISSGSIAALHTAYINTLDETVDPVTSIITANGGMEGNTDLPGSPLIGTYSYSGIKGVWNMSGALFDSGYIKAGDPALFGIQGTADQIVPYGYGRLFYGLGETACGSSTLNNQAKKVGVPTTFIPVPNGDHSSFYTDSSTVAEIDSVAPRFFGSTLCPDVLAISGAELKGSFANGQVKLSWQTTNEMNNKEFIVEKQSPLGWTSIGSINSRSVNGYSSFPINYAFNDLQPQSGANFYRLKIISINGEIAYSKTIVVSLNNTASSIFVVYPNPANDILHYKTTVTGNGINIIKIYTADMRLIQTSLVTDQQAVSISTLSAGLYLGVIYDNNKQKAASWFLKE